MFLLLFFVIGVVAAAASLGVKVTNPGETCTGVAQKDMGECRMDIVDSELGYLGYDSTEAYGVTWKVHVNVFVRVRVRVRAIFGISSYTVKIQASSWL